MVCKTKLGSTRRRASASAALWDPQCPAGAGQVAWGLTVSCLMISSRSLSRACRQPMSCRSSGLDAAFAGFSPESFSLPRRAVSNSTRWQGPRGYGALQWGAQDPCQQLRVRTLPLAWLWRHLLAGPVQHALPGRHGWGQRTRALLLPGYGIQAAECHL